MAYTKSAHGSDGSVTVASDYTDLVAGTHIIVREWSGSFVQDMFDDSSFDQSTNWKDSVGGMHDFKGTISGSIATGGIAGPLADFSTQNAPATTGDFTLQESAGETYTFKGILGGIRTVTTKTGRVDITLSVESSGAIAVNDAAE